MTYVMRKPALFIILSFVIQLTIISIIVSVNQFDQTANFTITCKLPRQKTISQIIIQNITTDQTMGLYNKTEDINILEPYKDVLLFLYKNEKLSVVYNSSVYYFKCIKIVYTMCVNETLHRQLCLPEGFISAYKTIVNINNIDCNVNYIEPTNLVN